MHPNAASHNNASWCTDTDGFLEHSPSRGSLPYKGPTLQKIIPGFGGSPIVSVQYISVLPLPFISSFPGSLFHSQRFFKVLHHAHHAAEDQDMENSSMARGLVLKDTP